MRVLTGAGDVDAHVLVLAANCLEDWGAVPTEPDEQFIDRLRTDYLRPEGIDLKGTNTPAVRRIIRHVRQIRRETT